MAKTDPKEYYKDEARELLENIENNLLDLEDSPDDDTIINNIFRALHTIKGSGSMFGYEHIAAFTHDVETMFDKIREGEVSASKEVINLTLASKDHIRSLLENEDEFADPMDEDTEKQLLLRLKQYLQKTDESAAAAEPAQPEGEEATEEPQEEKTYRIIFEPEPDIFLRGINPVLLLKEIQELGTSIIMPDKSNIPDLENLDPEKCYTKWTILLTTTAGINAVRDVFIFVEDYCKLRIEIIDEGNIDAEADYKRIGEILCEQGSLSEDSIQSILQQKPAFGEMARQSGVISEDDIQTALEEQKYVRDLRKKRLEVSTSSSIRVKNEKLDELVDLVGELVTLQARLSKVAEDTENSEFDSISESFERLTAELRDNTMNIRMIPLGETFRSFYRLVRDLSNDLGKQIELVTLGSDTELDKNIIDLLKDPLVHIIRNSVDHGIEAPAERTAKGKPEKGTVTIEAKHSGANVLITITDDGKGLDPQKIRTRAIQRGMISENDQLTDGEIYNLIFMPGFSTAEKATSVSGRGVGMDVVKKNIERLRGSVEVKSEKEKGSVIILSIPLTLSIIDGLLLSVADDKYIVNLNLVDECFDMTDDILHDTNGSNIVKLRGELIPFIRLRELFQYDRHKADAEQIAVVILDGAKIGIVIDNILGQYQTVIKPMSSAFKQLEEISGSTILGDGSIALILDINKLAKAVERVKA